MINFSVFVKLKKNNQEYVKMFVKSLPRGSKLLANTLVNNLIKELYKEQEKL